MDQTNPKVSRRGIIRAGVFAGVGLATGAARGAETRGKAFRVGLGPLSLRFGATSTCLKEFPLIS